MGNVKQTIALVASNKTGHNQVGRVDSFHLNKTAKIARPKALPLEPSSSFLFLPLISPLSRPHHHSITTVSSSSRGRYFCCHFTFSHLISRSSFSTFFPSHLISPYLSFARSQLPFAPSSFPIQSKDAPHSPRKSLSHHKSSSIISVAGGLV